MQFRLLLGVAVLALAGGCYSDLGRGSSATTGDVLPDGVNQVSFSVSGMT